MVPLSTRYLGALVCISCLAINAAALKFIVAPVPGSNSPVLDLMAVAAKLQSRGHSVTVVADDAAIQYAKMAAARHSSNTTAEAMHFVNLPLDRASSLDAMVEEMAPKVKALFAQSFGGVRLLLTLQEAFARPCKAIINNTNVLQQLREVGADAVMGINVPATGPSSDCCGCMLSHALGIAWIDVNGNPLLHGPLTVPQLGSGNTPSDLKTFKGFAKNLLIWSVKQLAPLLGEVLSPWGVARKQLGLPRASSGCLLTDSIAWLRGIRSQPCQPLLEPILSSWLLEYPRTLKPYRVLVGPGSPRPAHPAIEPPAVADFMDSAPDGVVLVAFGSTPAARIILTARDITELAEGLAMVAPTRVLWAVKDKVLPEGLKLAENVKAVPWVDYNDVLGHHNIRAVVSHCGWHSVNEAVFHGVPVVGMPFQFEQAENAHKLVAKGMAVVLQEAPAMRGRKNITFTRQAVAGAIKQVLADSSYAAVAREMSQALQAYSKRRHPYERAADEIELAINTMYVQQLQHHDGQDTHAQGAAATDRQEHQAEL